jgi:hypothetical protein
MRNTLCLLTGIIVLGVSDSRGSLPSHADEKKAFKLLERSLEPAIIAVAAGNGQCYRPCPCDRCRLREVLHEKDVHSLMPADFLFGVDKIKHGENPTVLKSNLEIMTDISMSVIVKMFPGGYNRVPGEDLASQLQALIFRLVFGAGVEKETLQAVIEGDYSSDDEKLRIKLDRKIQSLIARVSRTRFLS